jgi:hypothetical protein
MSGITDPAEGYFKDGLWGWDLTQWRKLPLLFGYSDAWADSTVNNDLDAGANNVDLTAVASGYVVVLTSLSFVYVGTPPTYVTVQLSLGGSVYQLYRQLAPASNQLYDRQGWWILEAEDFVRCSVVGATLHDDLRVTGTGYAMAIAE